MAPKTNPEWTKEVNNAIDELRGDMELRMTKLEEQMMGFMAKMDNYMGKRTEQPKEESNTEETSEAKGILGPLDITNAIRMAKQIEAKNKAMRKTVEVTSIEGRKHVDTQGP
eukprot:Gb_16902 [translate_table: standard]